MVTSTTCYTFTPREGYFTSPGVDSSLTNGIPLARYISKIQIVPIVMKPGSLDSSGDVEYYGFYSFALPFLVFEIFNF